MSASRACAALLLERQGLAGDNQPSRRIPTSLRCRVNFEVELLSVDFLYKWVLIYCHDTDRAADIRHEDARRSDAPGGVRAHRRRSRDRGDRAGEGAEGLAAGRVAASARVARGWPCDRAPRGAAHLLPPGSEGSRAAGRLAQHV